MSIKNFWSLNVDEALVADKLQTELKNKGYEVFFPLRSQLKDIDLILVNLKNKKSYTIQVKGSRTYAHIPQKREVERFGEGQSGWFTIRSKSIFQPENPIDYFIFLIHLETQGKIKKEIELHYLVIPIENFRNLLKNKEIGKHDLYDFFIWINPKERKAYDYREWKNIIELTQYLDNFDIFE